eukprot:3901804-Rhodomonas_salina.1
MRCPVLTVWIVVPGWLHYGRCWQPGRPYQPDSSQSAECTAKSNRRNWHLRPTLPPSLVVIDVALIGLELQLPPHAKSDVLGPVLSQTQIPSEDFNHFGYASSGEAFSHGLRQRKELPRVQRGDKVQPPTLSVTWFRDGRG